MSCYHPMVAFKNDYSKSYKPKYKFYGKLENIGSWIEVKEKYSDWSPILLPCGNCIGCRLDKSRTWADRMCLEFDHTKKAVFVTLTYDDTNLRFDDAGYPTLCKKDAQTFMKDLRGCKYYEGTEIRFYLSGEYSPEKQRPHMHVILFGLSLEDFSDDGVIRPFHYPEFYVGRSDHELYYDGKNKFGDVYYRCPYLESVVWKKGRCCITEFDWKTAAYTARYVTKKLTGERESEYGLRLPPFALMSRNPGISGYYLDDHPEKDLFEEIRFSYNGMQKPYPKFVFDKLKDIDDDSFRVYNAIKEQRKKYAEDEMLLKLQQTDLSYEGLLAVEEDRLKRVSTTLKRPLE